MSEEEKKEREKVLPFHKREGLIEIEEEDLVEDDLDEDLDI